MVSVIIPIYNTEKYLQECIDSVLNQTYEHMEVILVDDGSTDNSGKICDQYGVKDSRVIVIHKENGGISDARNAGLDIAKGKYIGFVDADDIIHPKMYELLVKAMQDYDTDVASCDFEIFSEDEPMGEEEKSNDEYTVVCVENREEYLHEFLKSKFTHYVWKSLYRKEVLQKLRFKKDKKVEDLIFCAELSDVLSARVEIKEKLYYYRVHKNSTMHSNPDIFIEHISSMEYAIDVFKKNEGIDFTRKYAEYVMGYILTKRAQMKLTGTLSKRVDEEIEKVFRCLYDEYGSRNKSYMLARYFPCLYKVLKVLLVKIKTQ